jgi:serine protease AprX
MTKKKNFFRQYRIPVFLITFVCVFALVGTGADMSKKVVKSDERVIELAKSPVRILLNGSATYRISLDGKSFSRELPQRHEIKFRGQVFDPLVNPPHMPEVIKAQAPGGIDLYIVQCVTQAIPAFQEEIAAAGGEICGTLPHQALIVAMSAEAFSRVRDMPFVRWVGHYHPSFKLEPGLDEVSRMAEVTKTRYSLWLAKKNKKDEVADFITGIGGDVVLKGKSRRMEANLNGNQLNGAAANPWVLAIDRCTPKEEDMNNARDIGGADYIETVQGYSGQGVRAEVCDGGLRTTHVDFQANPPLINAGNSSSTSHGTPVTGIVFGSGAGNADARGMLPDAEQPIFSCYNCFTDRYAHTQSVIALEGVFQTNSWGNTRTFFYTTISAEMDEIIFDLDILICQSQSNAGNQDSRPQAWAKNIVSVGGLRHYDTLSRSDDCWCTSASIGPADDGRIKPDVWHFYDYTLAPYYTSDTSYTQFGGTSGATPITAGHVGLIFQMWADGVFEGGPGLARDVFLNKPHFSTAKALLVHSAYQYPFSGTSHDKTRMHQGWGMPDVGNLYDMAQSHSWGFPVLIDESAVIAPLETHTYNVEVSGSDPLKATLVYADPPGVPGTTPHRINDLSLKVTAPNGTTYYWGNNGLDIGVWSASGGSSNTIDTVENVFIQNPTAGTWTIQVFGDEIVQDGHVETGAIDADYALIVSGGAGGTPPTPPAAPTGLTANAVSCNQIDLAWTDNSDNETSFKIERGTDGINFSQINTVGANVTAYSDTTAAESTTYYYRVRASNSAGDSDYSNTASATTPACPVQLPTAPTITKIKTLKYTADITWADNSNNEDGFYIYRGTSPTNLTLIATVGPNTTFYQDSGLTRKSTYYYKVCAYNASGESCSAVVEAKTK